MSGRPVSMRWEESLVERLQRRARLAGSSASALAQRYVDESLRMVEHPGLVFQDGPAGRRASLAAGPDVWEIVEVLRDTDERGDSAMEATAEVMGLDVAQVLAAARYYGAFPKEIIFHIEENRRAADEAHAAWQAEQRLLQ